MKAIEMRLIFKGKILKPDEKTIEDFKITDGLTIHLVKSKASAPGGGATTTLPTESSDSTGATSAPLDTGAAQPNPFAGMGGMGGGMPPGFGGMGGMGGQPGQMPNMDPAMM